MAKLTINVAPKAFTPTLACLELVTDIYKDTKTLEIDLPLSSVLGTFFYVRNKCGADIVLPETSWANNTENGGNLNLKSLPTNIPANSITKVFMAYNGTYKGDAKELIYTLSLNNTMANYAFTAVKKIVNIAPTSTDINILLKNRENFSFVLTTFLDKFRDADGDALTHIKLTGITAQYTLNNTPYVVGTEIAIADVVNLKFIANDINDETTSIAQFQMKSSDGTWSNVSNITIKNAVFVYVAPPQITIISGGYDRCAGRGDVTFEIKGAFKDVPCSIAFEENYVEGTYEMSNMNFKQTSITNNGIPGLRHTLVEGLLTQLGDTTYVLTVNVTGNSTYNEETKSFEPCNNGLTNGQFLYVQNYSASVYAGFNVEGRGLAEASAEICCQKLQGPG